MKQQEEEADKILKMYKMFNVYDEDFKAEIIKIQDYLTAKQCAIFHVEGIIEELEYHKWQNRLRVEYWQEVLEIIKNK